MTTDEERLADQRFYHSPAWRTLRTYQLRCFPLCADCGRPGNEVHHIANRKKFPALELDSNNLLTLCTPCHSRRTSREMLDRYSHHVILYGHRQQRAAWLAVNKKPDDLVVDPDSLADCIGFARLTLPPSDITALLQAWRNEALRMLKAEAFSRRCVICCGDWTTAEGIAADLGVEVTEAARS